MKLPIVAKFFLHQLLFFLGKATFHFPLSVYFYLTYRCNLSCSYCDTGDGNKFPDRVCQELSPGQWEKIIEKIAPYSDILMLSGGEPLLYPGFSDVVNLARKHGFPFVSLSTNGILLTEEIAESVNAIIISLDSLEPETSDRLLAKKGATERILQVLSSFSGRRHPTVMVNSVILPENISDVSKILDYCLAHGFTFSAGPGLNRTKGVKGLLGNPEYGKLIDKIIQAKKAGGRIAGTVDYLRAAKYFRPFFCNPLLVWRVQPNGALVYPCSRLNWGAESLLGDGDPIKLFRKIEDGNFISVDCNQSCPLSCYMDTSFMTQRPLSLIREGLLRLRSFSHGHRTVF